MEKPWRVISNADGVDEEFATLDEAVKEAESVLDLWRQQACDDGEWDEDVEGVEVHLVTHAARITRRDGDNEEDGVEYGITEILGNEIAKELHQLRAEVARLMVNNELFQTQNEMNAQQYTEACEVNRRQFEALFQAEKERDRYKAALERMVEMGCIGADESGRCGDCPVCDAEDALAAEAVRG